MADRPQSFSDWISQQGRVTAPAVPRAQFDVSTLANATNGQSTQAKEGDQDFLGWLVDILTRPLSGVTNVVQNTVNRGVDTNQQIASGDLLGAAGTALGSTSLGMAGDFLTGLLSTDPNTHRTFSDVIEQSTDKIGGAADPNYVDQPDNVNPVLKGVTGFAADVLLDPLTWIPGAQIAKGAGIASKAARGALQAGKAGVEAIKPIVQATRAGRVGEQVLQDLPIEQIVRDVPERDSALNDLVDTPMSTTTAKIGSEAPTPALAPIVPESVADQIKVNPRAAKMVEVLDDLARERPRALPQPETGAPGAVLDPTSWWNEYQALATGNPSYKQTVRVRTLGNAPRELTFQEVTNSLKNGNGDVQRALVEMYQKYREAWNVAQRRAKPGTVDALSRLLTNPIKAAEEAVPPTESLVRQMERYQELLQRDVERVEGAFGVGLTDQLRRMSNPDRFDQIIQRMSEILRPTTDLSDITDLTGEPALRRMFQALGIDPVGTNVARRQVASNVGGPSVNEALERMADPKLGAVSQADDDVLKSLPPVVKDNFFNLDSYKYTTKGGTKRTDEGLGKGLGRDERAMNTHYQWDFFHKLTDRASERIKQARQVKAGPGRASVVDKEVMEALLRGEELMDRHGIPMYLDFGGEKLPISIGQVLEVLHEDSLNLMRQVLFNVETAVPTTNLADAVFFAVKKDADFDLVNATLAKVDLRNTKEGVIPNALADGGAGRLRYGYLPRTKSGKPPADTEDFRYVPHREGRSIKGWYKVWDADRIRARLSDAILRQAPRLREIATQNAEAYSRRLASETLDLTQQQVDELSALVADPEALGAALRAMGDVPSRIQKEAFEAGTFKESSDTATVLVTESAPPLAVQNAEGGVKTATAVKTAAKKESHSGKKPKEQARATQEAGKPSAQGVFNEQADFADEITDTLDASRDWADSSKVNREIKSGIIGKLDPLNKAFNYKAGMTHIADLLNNSGALHANWTAVRHQQMNQLNRLYGGMIPGTERTYLQQAFQDLQRGVKSTEPTVAAANAELGRLMGELLDLSGDPAEQILGNAFFRNNVGIEHLNIMLEKEGLPLIDTDAAARLVKEGRAPDLLTAASNQWREWKIEDPLDFISKFSHAAMRLFTDASIGQSFTRRALRQGWAVSEPRKGFSRIRNTDGSAISGAIPKDLYVRDDMLTELKRLEEVMYSGSRIGGDLGQFVENFFDPIQRAWKKGITIYRPGHHVRNQVGDFSMTFVAEGTQGFRKSVKDAFKVMQLRNEYEGVDLVRALNELGEYRLAGQGDVLSSGRFGDITANDLFDAAERSGLFRNARVVEDIVDENVGNPLAKITDILSLTGTPIEKAAMGVSEYREHFSRLQHFLQIIEKAQKGGTFFDGLKGTKYPKTLDELFSAASERVKRYHPDASMLSPFERTYMRRLIPFYSWFRGIMPAIVESLMLHPGRVSVFPKASYALAVSMGVDPNSLSDPFPDDQLFPSFLTEQMTGPQFKIGDSYFGINPGIAHLDVLNQFATDPVRGVAGMTSPVLRIPAELLSGGSWGTGAQIKDNSDYIDASLPGLNYLANISGFSPTGSAVSLLSGQGLDPQYQQAAGNKGATDQLLSVLNWFTGLGVNNQSRPNYINYAEIEKRNEAAGQTGGF